MAYTKRNHLLRMKAVVDRYKELEKTGLSVVKIHSMYIWPEFKVSKATLYAYLSTPIERELKKLDEKIERYIQGLPDLDAENQTSTNQLKLF